MTTEAHLQQVSDTATIRLERRLARPPQDVWCALTERAELAKWFPCDVLVERWEVGAPLRFVFTEDGFELSGVVLEVAEGHVLAFTWGEDRLRFELTATADGGTELVLHDELPRAWAARNAAGWDVCLARLTADDALPEWKHRFDLYVERFAATAGAQEGPPAEFTG